MRRQIAASDEATLARLRSTRSHATNSQSTPTPNERRLLSDVVALAERIGRPVRLLIVPARDVLDAIVGTVIRLRSSDVYVGESVTLSAADQARLLGEAWERTDKPETHDVRLVICHRSGRTETYHLGAHPHVLTGHLQLPGPLLQLPSAGADGLVAGEDDGVAGVGQQVTQVVDDPAAGRHAGRGHDDAGGPRVVEPDRLLGRARGPEPGQGRQLGTGVGAHLGGVLGVLVQVEGLECHGAVGVETVWQVPLGASCQSFERKSSPH